MCAKEIRCLLTLRNKLVVDERNEALDSSLQGKTDASFLLGNAGIAWGG